MDWKSKYYKEGNTPQTDIFTPCNPKQNPKRCYCFVLLESDEQILKFIGKCKGPNHVKEEKQSGESCSIKYQDLLQIDSNQDSVAMAEGRTCCWKKR